ncbi:hypothetical protein FRC12_003334 [Ceratobasidium sp. 428]|nr:hypothetical protein FRC12_003334 [Ceratobasidium sp. 428]
MRPVSPVLTFTSAGRTPTMTTIATPRHEDDNKGVRSLPQVYGGGKESGLQLKLNGEGEGEATTLATGLTGIEEADILFAVVLFFFVRSCFCLNSASSLA